MKAPIVFMLFLVANADRCTDSSLPTHRWLVKQSCSISGGHDVHESWGLVRNFRQCVEECARAEICEAFIWDKASWNCWLKYKDLPEYDHPRRAVFVEDHISVWKKEATTEEIFEEVPQPDLKNAVNITSYLHMNMRHQLLARDGVPLEGDSTKLTEPPCPDDAMDPWKCLSAGTALPANHPMAHLYKWADQPDIDRLKKARSEFFCNDRINNVRSGVMNEEDFSSNMDEEERTKLSLEEKIEKYKDPHYCYEQWLALNEKLITLVNDLDIPVEVFQAKSTTARDIIFVNDMDRDVEVFFSWNDGVQEDISSGVLPPGSQQLQHSHVGHLFYFMAEDELGKRKIGTHVVTEIPCVVISGDRTSFDYYCKDIVGIPKEWIVAELPPKTADQDMLYLVPHTKLWFKEKNSVNQIREIVISFLPKDHQMYSASGRRPDDRSWLNVFPRIPITLPILTIPNKGDPFQFTSTIPFWYKKQPADREIREIETATATAAQNTSTSNSNLNLNREAPFVMQGVVVAERPRALVFPRMISDDEAQHIIDQATKRTLRPSYVGSGTGEASDDRKSANAYIPDDCTPIVSNISTRIYQAMNLTKAQGHRSCELQIVHYSTGGIYKPHFDFFDPFPKSAAAFEEVQSGTNRFATFMLYLNTPAEGGGTVFPDLFDGALVVEGVQGRGLLWYSTLPSGNLDMFSRHGGMPVLKGEKWIATYFCWDRLIWNEHDDYPS